MTKEVPTQPHAGNEGSTAASPPLSGEGFLAAAMRVFDGEIVSITLGREEADRRWQERLAASRQPRPATPQPLQPPPNLELTPLGERFMARSRAEDALFAAHGPDWWRRPEAWKIREEGWRDQPPVRPDRRRRWSFREGQRGIDRFWQFCRLRQLVNVSRFAERQEPPWTDDAILREHRFTGPYRAFDRGTRFLAHAALERGLSPEERLWAVLLYRQYNLPTTYRLLQDAGLATVDGFEPERVTTLLLAHQPVFSAAYRIVNSGGAGAGATLRQSVRDLEIARQRLPELLAALQAADSCQRAILVLKQLCPGLGDPRNAGASFYAHERLQDLADGAVLTSNVLTHLDLNGWAYAGPGAANALTREMGIPAREYQQAMQVLREAQPADFPGPRFHAATVEFSLCEYSKFCRISRGYGFKRRPYRPGTFDPALYPPAVIERFCRTAYEHTNTTK